MKLLLLSLYSLINTNKNPSVFMKHKGNAQIETRFLFP